MYFEMSDEGFVEAVLDRLEQESSPVIYIHRFEGAPAEAVLVGTDRWREILDKIPMADELLMDHTHIEPEG